MKYIKGILDQIGLGGERVEMFNMSSSEGPKFAQVAQEMTDRIKALGPSPAKRETKGSMP